MKTKQKASSCTVPTKDVEGQSLSDMVAIYRKDASSLTGYLKYFQMLTSLEDAIRFACHGKDGKIYGHQHLVGKKKLELARLELQKQSDEIAVCESFEDLLTLVQECTRGIKGFGVLAVYDTALRLGAYLGKWPKVVYVHAGTKDGCRALGVSTRGGKVAIEDLPKPIQRLKPYQAEDFLCIFKDRFPHLLND